MRSLRCLFYGVVFFLGIGSIYAQGDRCAAIQPFCAGDAQLVFPNSHPGTSSQSSAEVGPYYGCLDSQPYPAWFYLQVASSGNLVFTIRQTENPDGTGRMIDVDFIVWGPFTGQDDVCSASSLSQENAVDCSFSAAAVEEMTIRNALEGEVYVVLITNYDEIPGYISLQQSNAGAGGATDCSIVESALGSDRVVCGETSTELDATTTYASTYKWYKFNNTSGSFELIAGEEGATLVVDETGEYQVVVRSDFFGTESSDQVYIEFASLPVASQPAVVIGCIDGERTLYDLEVTSQELIGSAPGNYTTNFYLSRENYENGVGINNNTFAIDGHENTFILGTVLDTDSGCESLPVDIELQAAPAPFVEIPAVTAFCIDLNANLISPVTIGEDLGEGYIYNWSVPNDPDGDGVENPVLVLNSYPGQQNITLHITDELTGCTSFFSTELKVFSAAQEVLIDISGSDFTGGYQITAMAIQGFGEETSYEYRLDNGLWQESPVFTAVQAGSHRVWAREINGCGVTGSSSFNLFGYPRFFTPNNDGYNDVWNLIYDAEINVERVLIFDRYGKLLKEIKRSGSGWDGTFNGKLMPASDYWFLVEYRDSETGGLRSYRAHFTLKR